MPDERSFATLQVHAGQEEPDPVTGARAVPVYLNSAYVFASAEDAQARFDRSAPGYQYGRMHNPTVEAFAKRIQALEGGRAAVAFSSGQAATTAVLLSLARPGTNLVLSRELFGGTFAIASKLLAPWGCELRTVAPEAEAVRRAVDDRTIAVWFESIANPSGTVPDLPALAGAAHDGGAPLIVDNTFGAGGYLCRPLEQGADVVVHSATKWIGGHGTFLAGVVVDGGNFEWSEERFPALFTVDRRGNSPVSLAGRTALANRVHELGLSTMGMTLSPHDAFLGLQGLETLSFRLDRECATTQELAEWLQGHAAVRRVVYPGLPEHPSHEVAKRVLRHGFGAVFCFEATSEERARAFLDRVELASHLANVGDSKTIVIQPWCTTHSGLSEADRRAAGVTPELIRVSVGLEDPGDLKRDFAQALEGGV